MHGGCMAAHAGLTGVCSRLAVVYRWPAKSATNGHLQYASLCCPVTARVRKLTDVPAVADDPAPGRVAARCGLSLQSAGAVLQGRCALAVPAHLEIPPIWYAAAAAACLISQHTYIFTTYLYVKVTSVCYFGCSRASCAISECTVSFRQPCRPKTVFAAALHCCTAARVNHAVQLVEPE